MSDQKPRKRKTTVKSQIREDQAVKKVLEEGKSIQQAAKEIGINRNTVTKLIYRALNDEEVKQRIQRSRDRVVKMLSLADEAFLRVLKYNHPENFANQIKTATSIYRTMGVLSDEPMIKIQSHAPVVVKVEGQTFEFSAPKPDAAS